MTLGAPNAPPTSLPPSRPVAVALCPGRGSYGRNELGFIRKTLRPGALADLLAEADAERQRAGEPTISELDQATQFKPGAHLHGPNAAELIWFSTLAHLEEVRTRYEIAAVAGNSLGWYTALAAAGALSLADGWRLVRTMARLQELAKGGQILTTLVDERWHRDPAQVTAVAQALRATNALGATHLVAESIRLGGHAVLAGTEAGVSRLLTELPKSKLGEREFPFRLAGHGPFHTALCDQVAARAKVELAALAWQSPQDFLIDGLGTVLSPWSTEPSALLHYTATTQVLQTFDFTAAVRTAIREFNPDALVCLGPGESLRAPVGHVVISEGWRGVRDKASLFGADVVRVG